MKKKERNIYIYHIREEKKAIYENEEEMKKTKKYINEERNIWNEENKRNENERRAKKWNNGKNSGMKNEK